MRTLPLNLGSTTHKLSEEAVQSDLWQSLFGKKTIKSRIFNTTWKAELKGNACAVSTTPEIDQEKLHDIKTEKPSLQNPNRQQTERRKAKYKSF